MRKAKVCRTWSANAATEVNEGATLSCVIVDAVAYAGREGAEGGEAIAALNAAPADGLTGKTTKYGNL